MSNENAIRREVGAIALMFTGLGSIIGSGWLFGAWRAAQLAGPGAVYSWIIGAVIILFVAFTYAELGAMFPESGGAVRYGHYSHGSLVGFVAGWAAWIAIVSVIPVEAEASVQYMSSWPWTWAQQLYVHAANGQGELTIPGLSIAAEPVARPDRTIADADAALIAGVLAGQHHGVLAMSPDIPGLVQTSTNLAIVATRQEEVEIATSQRSSIESSKRAAARMVASIFRFTGFEVEPSGDYPGWKPEPASDIVRLAQAVHQEVLGRKPELIAMHAGLECGVIGEKYPGMQMVSFGPTIVDPHSPNERVQISSVESFWSYLKLVLENL